MRGFDWRVAIGAWSLRLSDRVRRVVLFSGFFDYYRVCWAWAGKVLFVGFVFVNVDRWHVCVDVVVDHFVELFAFVVTDV